MILRLQTIIEIKSICSDMHIFSRSKASFHINEIFVIFYQIHCNFTAETTKFRTTYLLIVCSHRFKIRNSEKRGKKCKFSHFEVRKQLNLSTVNRALQLVPKHTCGRVPRSDIGTRKVHLPKKAI